MPLSSVEDFYRDSHQIIYRAIRDLYDLGKAIDAITLVRRAYPTRTSSRKRAATMPSADPRTSSPRRECQVLRPDRSPEVDQPRADRMRERDAPRRLLEQLHGRGTARSRPSSGSLRSPRIRPAGDTIEIKDVIVEAMDRIIAGAEDRHAVTGVATGFLRPRRHHRRIPGDQLIILAARPSMGKTALALNICDHAICELKKAVLFVSLEMGELELADRLLSSRPGSTAINCGRVKVSGLSKTWSSSAGLHRASRDLALDRQYAAPGTCSRSPLTLGGSSSARIWG